jgi:hypothetical protein
MGDDYVVCEFKADEVEVVCEKWLSNDKQRCFFPPSKNYNVCIRRKLFDESWDQLKCRVLTKSYRKFSIKL